jgi:membrane-associated HD superfamily phosphohydrolase
LPQFTSYFGTGIAIKGSQYTSPAHLEQLSAHLAWAKSQGKWYLYLPGKMTYYYITISFFYFYYRYKKYITSKQLKSLYSFNLLFFATANFISVVPSASRFLSVSYLFALAFIIEILTIVQSKKDRWLIIVGIIPFLLNLIVVVRLAIDIMNPWIFTLLPFPFLFPEQSIYQFIF